MSLFWQEHKKLWRSGLTRLAVCGMLLLTLGLQVWAMQCINFGTMRADGSHQIDGYANIRKSQQYAAQWQTLTDETAQDMVRTYQQILAENPEFDGALADFSFLQGTLVSFLWPEVEDQTQTYPTLTIYYVDPARLTGLYERREEKLEYYLENQFSDPADRQFFLDMDSQVDKPMAYGWAAGWSAILGNGIGGFGQMVLPVVLALALTSVFNVSLDYIFGLCEDPRGRYFCVTPEGAQGVVQRKPDWSEFVEACFTPGSELNRRLKQMILNMGEEEKHK